jgi:hypothetical protein
MLSYNFKNHVSGCSVNALNASIMIIDRVLKDTLDDGLCTKSILFNRVFTEVDNSYEDKLREALV